jgi:transketolase
VILLAGLYSGFKNLTNKNKRLYLRIMGAGDTIDQAAVNTLRVLGCEAIAAAKSGHSGIVLGAAPIIYAVYKSMNFDPSNGAWFNRDRFVMSAGHGSALLYATLKCFGFQSIDLATFRQSGSILTGHPELNEKIGVDCSTGPLGQGIAMAVGIAAAEKRLAAEFNGKAEKTAKKTKDIVDHHTFCLVGDGCLMEGVSYEACNLAGLWRLNKLIVVYDCNGVTLDGTRGTADVEDTVARFKSMRWNVAVVKNGNDENEIFLRIKRARTSKDAPTLIIVNTEIGYAAKNAGTHKAHGQVLTLEETMNLRRKWDLTHEVFGMDEDIRGHFERLCKKKTGLAKKWKRRLYQYKKIFPKKCAELLEFIEKPEKQYKCKAEGKAMATRDAGCIMLNQIAKQNVRLWGGSADLSSTTKAFIADGGIFAFNRLKASDIAFGVREFAMAAVTNGLALHGFTPYCSTFLAFSDYCKAAVRMTALMDLPVTYIFSHDGLGNAPDGPTHQATEHIAALRLIPNISVFRPADDLETAAVYEYIFEKQKPACVILGRGTVPSPSGAHTFSKKDGLVYAEPDCNILSSGTEVHVCVAAQKILTRAGVPVNVISVPCLEMFDAANLNKNMPVVAVEMGCGMPWWAFIGKNGLRGSVISFDTFGESGKDADIMRKLGFTPEQIAENVLRFIKDLT